MSEFIQPGDCFVQQPAVLNRPAADFTAEGYYRGERKTFKLSDFRRQWFPANRDYERTGIWLARYDNKPLLL